SAINGSSRVSKPDFAALPPPPEKMPSEAFRVRSLPAGYGIVAGKSRRAAGTRRRTSGHLQ
ncbi:TPA: hypothetical protein ACLA2B_001742, partial [Neisseria meningitidis]